MGSTKIIDKSFKNLNFKSSFLRSYLGFHILNFVHLLTEPEERKVNEVEDDPEVPSNTKKSVNFKCERCKSTFRLKFALNRHLAKGKCNLRMNSGSERGKTANLGRKEKSECDLKGTRLRKYKKRRSAENKGQKPGEHSCSDQEEWDKDHEERYYAHEKQKSGEQGKTMACAPTKSSKTKEKKRLKMSSKPCPWCGKPFTNLWKHKKLHMDNLDHIGDDEEYSKLVETRTGKKELHSCTICNRKVLHKLVHSATHVFSQ